MSSSIIVEPSGVTLFGYDLLNLRSPECFRAAFGNPSRSREIKMHPGGTRIAMVWDNLGLIAYEDCPEACMSHLHMAFDPHESPEIPKHPCEATIVLNGIEMEADMTERALPRAGPTPIMESFGRRCFYQCDRFILDFHFEKRLDDFGRKSGVRRLALLSFSWRSPVAA